MKIDALRIQHIVNIKQRFHLVRSLFGFVTWYGTFLFSNMYINYKQKSPYKRDLNLEIISLDHCLPECIKNIRNQWPKKVCVGTPYFLKERNSIKSVLGFLIFEWMIKGLWFRPSPPKKKTPIENESTYNS